MVVLQHLVAKTHSHTKSICSVHLSALDSQTRHILPLSCWQVIKITIFAIDVIITITL